MQEGVCVCVHTMEMPVEKCVAAATDVVSGCCGTDGSLRRISRMWFAGMSENIYTNHITTRFTEVRGDYGCWHGVNRISKISGIYK